MRRFESEPDVSAKRALLVALGGFPPEVVPAAERETLTGRLLALYREHPDPGLHGAIDWLLRRKWGKGKELAAIDATLRPRIDPVDFACSAGMAVAARALGPHERSDLLARPSAFGMLLVWQTQDHLKNGSGVEFVREAGRPGWAFVVRSPAENDVLVYQRVAVRPNTTYELSGWVRTEGVVAEEKGRTGATLSVWGGSEVSKSLLGSEGWTRLSVRFDSGDRTSVEVGGRLGYHGSVARGAAWFYDLSLAEARKGAFFEPERRSVPLEEGKGWYVNGEGQTFAVVRGPVEFTLGSPPSEPGRYEAGETPHRKRISRTFAIGAKEVTVEQFLRFRPNHWWAKQYSPGPDTPAVSVTWYDAAAYCNWLSEREGISPDQWCYEPAKGGGYGEGMRMRAGHLKLTGYRLPTEAEWEFACRSGAVTSRYHGRGEDLLPRYGWFASNAEDRMRPVGSLRPNELGLFDTLGNVVEWVADPALLYVTSQTEDIENRMVLPIEERTARRLRGGSLHDQPINLRCAYRNSVRPGVRNVAIGFRPVRTLS
jgi:formylglycine-generating enzyme required for sulfatase activity